MSDEGEESMIVMPLVDKLETVTIGLMNHVLFEFAVDDSRNMTSFGANHTAACNASISNTTTIPKNVALRSCFKGDIMTLRVIVEVCNALIYDVISNN